MAVAVGYTKSSGSVHDANLVFSDGQALTTSHISTNVMNLGTDFANGVLALGNGTPKRIKVVVTETFTDGTSVAIKFETSEDEGLASSYIVAQTPAIAEASLVAGATFELTIPEGLKFDQYIGMRYTSVGTHATGKVDAFVEPN